MKSPSSPYRSILRSCGTALYCALGLFVYGAMVMPAVSTADAVDLLAPALAMDASALPATATSSGGSTGTTGTPVQVDQSPLTVQAAIPPDITLMLDDSGSMAWDFMPDWDYLGNGLPSGWNSGNYGVRNSAINGLYYNPATTYVPPPKADSSTTSPDLYPNSPSITGAFADGFTDTTHFTNVTTYGGDPFDENDAGGRTPFAYYASLPTTEFVDYGPAVEGCPYGYSDPTGSGQCIRAPTSPVTTWQCYSPPSNQYVGTYNGQKWCYTQSEGVVTWIGPATAVTSCPSGTTGPDSSGLCDYPTRTPVWQCPNGGGQNGATPTPECVARLSEYVFTYTTGAPGSYTIHYVATGSYTLNKNAAGYISSISGSDCGIVYNSTQQANCVNAGDTSGVAAPAGVAAGQNVANWFSYYRTRVLMAKSGLMTAFSTLDPSFRVGFGSINGGPGGSNNSQYFPSTASSVAFAYPDAFNGGTNYIYGDAPFDSNCATNPTTCTPGQAGTQRAAFWNWISQVQPGGQTPLRQALDAVGKYYQSSQPWLWMSTDPGYANRGNASNISCRQANTILTTDGFWNGNFTSSAAQGASDSNGPSFTDANGNPVGYKAMAPFSGGDTTDSSPSLADVATYYWENDLQTGLSNEVPTNTDDPAFWQHMVTFTMGLGFTPTGITGTASNGDNPPTTQDIFNWAGGGAAISGFSWPNPSAANGGSINNIADLEHAGVNGHGGFFSARDPQTFLAGIETALKRASERVGTGASLGANSTKLETGTFVYQAQYYTGSWKGDLLAVGLNAATGAPAASPTWTAAAALNGQAVVNGNVRTYPVPASGSSTGRTIETYNTATGKFVPFVDGTGSTPPALASDQLANLGSNAAAQATMVNYLRGDNTNEESNGGTYRTRTTPLGDIVDSAPVYDAAPDPTEFNGESFPGTTLVTDSSGVTYSPFLAWAEGTTDSSGTLTPSAASQRAGMIYVAGDDGMLHIFNASTGNEVYAYLPGALLINQTDPVTGLAEPLADLANPAYGSAAVPHQDYNDGQVTVADAYLQLAQTGDTSPQWHTILVGTTGRGPARAVYALDVTNPFNVVPLWERYAGDNSTLDSNSGYIGQMTGTPVIAQTSVSTPSSGPSTGTWSALIGNGYNSPKGVAALLQFNLATGQLHVHTTNTATGNGLAPVYTWMSNSSSGVTDLAYAGDLGGHVWQFNLDSTSCSGSGSSQTCTTSATPDSAGTSIFTAVGAGGNVQPITAGMLVAENPTDSGLWLFFGTGEYLNQNDISSKAVQTWYGLIVTPGANNAAPTNLTGRSVLAQRSIIYEDAGVDGGYPARAVTPLPSPPDICNYATTTTSGRGGGAGSSSCKLGWYMDLVSPVNDTAGVTPPASVLAQGERMVVPNQLQGGLLVGTSIIPRPANQPFDPCEPAGAGWIMAIDPFTGSNPPKDFFDRNKDGTIGGGDGVVENGNTVPAAGIGVGSLPNAPIFVGGHAIVSLANGSLVNVATRGGNGVYQRVSWREVVNP